MTSISETIDAIDSCLEDFARDSYGNCARCGGGLRSEDHRDWCPYPVARTNLPALRSAVESAVAPLTEHEWGQLRALANGWPYPTVGVTEDEDEEIRSGLEVVRREFENTPAGALVLRMIIADHAAAVESAERMREAIEAALALSRAIVKPSDFTGQQLRNRIVSLRALLRQVASAAEAKQARRVRELETALRESGETLERGAREIEMQAKRVAALKWALRSLNAKLDGIAEEAQRIIGDALGKDGSK